MTMHKAHAYTEGDDEDVSSVPLSRTVDNLLSVTQRSQAGDERTVTFLGLPATSSECEDLACLMPQDNAGLSRQGMSG